MLETDGVKITPTFVVPAFGAIALFTKANAPVTAVPAALVKAPVGVELASVCPKVIALAENAVATSGVCLFTVTVTVAVAVL